MRLKNVTIVTLDVALPIALQLSDQLTLVRGSYRKRQEVGTQWAGEVEVERHSVVALHRRDLCRL
jgi:hypothetical protein